MIVFTHTDTAQVPSPFTPILTVNTHDAIPLEPTIQDDKMPYHIQPPSTSYLRGAYDILHHKTEYQIVLHYTWLQPANNQKPILLSSTDDHGWNVTGTVKIRRSNYYLLDTELLLSPENHPEAAFIMAQKQRLKPGVIYYLDNPKAGVLITVKQIT